MLLHKEDHHPQLDKLLNEITNIVDSNIHNKALSNPSFEKGLLGFSLYNAYLAHLFNDTGRAQIAQECLINGLNSLNLTAAPNPILTSSVDYFLSQIGRFLQFIDANEILEIDNKNYLKGIDQLLSRLLTAQIERKNFDFGAGAIGAGYYFLDRIGKFESAEDLLLSLINGIKRSANVDADGDFYWTSPTYYNRVYLGISHGSSMIISFVASAIEKEIEVEACREILRNATNFVNKQYRETRFKGLFPNMVGEEISDMQFALCYGDIGVGFALLKASKFINSTRNDQLCAKILKNCLTRSFEEGLTLDASIFYGAAGLGLAFEKIAEMSGQNEFSRRAEYWYTKIPAYANFGDEYAGFQSRLHREENSWHLFNLSFAFGITGIGLTLMRLKNQSLPSLDKLTFLA